MRGNPSDGGVDCDCSRNFVSMLSSATAPEMDIVIIINRQTNTHEHQWNSKKPSPSTPKPNTLVARSSESANNSTNNLRLQGERSCLAAIAGDQALYEERYESSLATRNTKAGNAAKVRQLSFRNGDAMRIGEFFCRRRRIRARSMKVLIEMGWRMCC